MDFGAPKEVKVVCGKCENEKEVCLHWKNSVLFSVCKDCGSETKYEFKDWEVVKKRVVKLVKN